MSERERWIVYPLLFLALGAALRDKIIKTTESQRIKCQGLCVYDSNDQPLLILGPEQFPELRPDAPNLIRVEEIFANRVTADVLEGNKVEGVQFVAPQDRVGKLVANQVAAATVVANQFVLTDGKNNLRVDGRYTVPIMRMLSFLTSRYQASQQAEEGASETGSESVQPDAADQDSAAPPAASDSSVPPDGQEAGQRATEGRDAPMSPEPAASGPPEPN